MIDTSALPQMDEHICTAGHHSDQIRENRIPVVKPASMQFLRLNARPKLSTLTSIVGARLQMASSELPHGHTKCRTLH